MADDSEKLPSLILKNMILDPDHWTEVLRKRRLEKGLTIRELSELSEVSSSAVHRMEQGYYLLQVDRFLRVLDVLDLRPEDVLVVDDQSKQTRPAAVELKLIDISRLDAPDALRKLANLLEEHAAKESVPKTANEVARPHKEDVDDKGRPEYPNDEFYDKLTIALLRHLVSLAGETGITPPVSTPKIANIIGDDSSKGKRTNTRIEWLINNGYISKYAKHGGPRGRQFKIESKAYQYLENTPSETKT